MFLTAAECEAVLCQFALKINKNSVILALFIYQYSFIRNAPMYWTRHQPASCLKTGVDQAQLYPVSQKREEKHV